MKQIKGSQTLYNSQSIIVNYDNVLTVFSCSYCYFSVILSFLNCEGNYSDVVCVIGVQGIQDYFSLFRIYHYPRQGHGLQLGNIESVFPDDPIMGVFWRMCPIDVDRSGVKLDSSNVSRSSNWCYCGRRLKSIHPSYSVTHYICTFFICLRSPI